MSWDGTLSSGGVQKHGSPQHVTQGNPGTYAMPFAVTYDAAGAESAAYQAWSATPTYPANTYVLGSNSKLYRAVISNAGNDPTTDSGTNWVRVSVPTGGASSGQVPVWDNTAKEYLPGAVSGTLASGTVTNSTLRWNGSGWVETTFLKNSDSQVTVNSPTSPPSGVPLVIKVAGSSGQPSGLTIQDETASDPVCMTVLNTATSVGFQFGLSGATDGFMPGTSQGDGILRLQKDGKRIWIGSKLNSGDTTGTAIMALDQTGVVLGSTAAAGAKLDVTAASGALAGLFTGTSGNTVLKVSGSGGTGSNAVALIATDFFPGLQITSSATPGVGSGGGLVLATGANPTGANQTIGTLAFDTPSATGGSYQAAARIIALSTGAHSTSASAGSILFQTTPPSTVTPVERMRILDVGDIVLNNTGSQLATNATGPFLHLGNMAGLPTGTPTTIRTGATPLAYDTTGNRLYAYNSGWVDICTRPPVALADGATINTDASLGRHFRVTLGGNRTMAAPTNPTDGQRIVYEIIQPGSGGPWTIATWNAIFVFGTDVPSPTLTATASKRDFVGFVYNSTAAKWYCLAAAKGY
jgi:hypothetical protein